MNNVAAAGWLIPTDRPFDLDLNGTWICDCRYAGHSENLLVVDYPVLNRMVRAQVLLCRIGSIRHGLTDDESLSGEPREIPVVEVKVVQHD